MNYLLILVALAAFSFMIVYMQRPLTYYREPQPQRVIHASPDSAIPGPDVQPVAVFGTVAPSLPITSSAFATTADLAAYNVRYISANGLIREHCLKKVMADSIPTEKILPSSLDSQGNFKNVCAAQQSVEYKPWPF